MKTDLYTDGEDVVPSTLYSYHVQMTTTNVTTTTIIDTL